MNKSDKTFSVKNKEKLKLYTKNKNLFLFLGLAVIILMTLFLFLVWLVAQPGLERINLSLDSVIFILILIFSVFIGFSFIFMSITAVFGIKLTSLHIYKIVLFLMPFISLLGKLIGKSKEEVRNSFISLNNALVIALKGGREFKKLLILLPHCIQWFECSFRVTGDITNCRRCGKCQIPDILDIMEEYSIKAAVATGGTLARKIVQEEKPEFIIAVACERDLTYGILDVYPIPVLGILNERPEGPCINTRFDLEKFKLVLKD